MKVNPPPPSFVLRKLPKQISHPDPTVSAEPQSPWEAKHYDTVERRIAGIKSLPLIMRRREEQEVKPVLATTALLAEACALIYASADEIREYVKKAGFTDLKLFRPPLSDDADFGAGGQERPVGAIAFCDGQRIFLIFRGTHYCWDWTYNLSIWVCNRPRRHAGFQRAWNELAPEIRAWIEPRIEAGGVLHLAGHSLGGAIATIAASEFAEQAAKAASLRDTASVGTSELSGRVPIGSVVTLGSPRVGLYAFAAYYSQQKVPGSDRTLNEITHRYQHGIDIVTRLMPPPIGFKHVAPGEPLLACRVIEKPDARSEGARIVSSENTTPVKKILVPDTSTRPPDLIAQAIETPQRQFLVNALALVFALVLGRLGLTGIQPLSPMLGELGARQYSAALHHKSAIYAAILSPSNILGDWLNATPKKEPNVYGLIFAPLLVVALVYWLGGWNSVIWIAGILLALLTLGIIANIIDYWRVRKSRTHT